MFLKTQKKVFICQRLQKILKLSRLDQTLLDAVQPSQANAAIFVV